MSEPSTSSAMEEQGLESDTETIILPLGKSLRSRHLSSDDEDQFDLPSPNQTPKKRQRQIIPESPYKEFSEPVAQSTKYSSSDFTTPRRRKRLIMPFEIDLPEIKRSSRPASPASMAPASPHLRPESASIGSTRATSRRSSIASSDTSELYASDVDETVDSLNWDRSSDKECEEIIVSMEAVQIKHKGKDYDIFKPINTSGLYYDLVLNHLEYEIYIRRWETCYRDGGELESICELLQLFTDMMGFQVVIVKDIYMELEQQHFKTKVHPVVEKINSIKKQITNPMYLFTCKLQWSKGVRTAFHVFFDKFITACYTSGILYPVMVQLTYFFIHATQSDLLPVVHTSTTMVLMMMNTLVDHVISLLIKYGDSCQSKMLDWLKKMVLYYLYNISGSNKTTRILTDKRLMLVRFDVAYYLKFWIKRLPSLFLQEDKTYELLKQLLIDVGSTVRKEAMNSCIIIVSSRKIVQHVIKVCLTNLLTVVIGRFEDVDLTVANLAIVCHANAIRRFPSLILNKNMIIPSRVMGLLMLSKHPIIRQQAILNFCVTIKLLHLSEVEFLFKIVEFIDMLNNCSERSTFMAFLIEAVYKEVPELSNLELFLRAMDVDMDEKLYENILLELFCNSAKMQYLGRLEVVGENAAKVADVPNMTTKQSVTKIILDNFEMLINRYEECYVKCIFETLNIFSTQELEKPENAQIVTRLPQVLIARFDSYTNGEVLAEISKFFAHCMTVDRFVKRFFVASVTDLCTVARSFRAYYIFKIAARNFKEDVLTNEGILVKLHSLIKNVNVKKYSNLHWEDIYVNWNNFNCVYSTKISTLQIQCCQHYLTWHLKQIIGNDCSNDVVNEEIFKLQTNTTIYNQTLIALISNKKAKCSVRNIAFESLSYLCINFEEIIEGTPTENRHEYRNRVSLKKISQDDSAAICAFVTNKIDAAIKQKFTEKDLDMMRQYLYFILKMLGHSIDLVHASDILRYFTDELFFRFGDLFVKFLDSLAVNPKILSAAMWHTVRNVYNVKTCISTVPFSTGLTADKALISSILNQFDKYLRKRRKSSEELIRYAIKFVSYKQYSTELLLLFIPMLEKVPTAEINNLETDFQTYKWRNRNDLNIKTFKSKLSKG